MSERLEQAKEIVKNHALITAGLGLIPVPLLDLAAVSAAQLRMLHQLSKVYGQPFKKERVRALVSALLGGSVPYALSGSSIASMAKAVPFVGSFLGAAAMPALSGAATLALGRVFTNHFEAGGTLLDFNPEKMRAYFQEQFEAAKKEAGAAPAATEEAASDAKKGSTGKLATA